MNEDVTQEDSTQPEEEPIETSLSDQVQSEINAAHERGYSEGYAAGQSAQRTEDSYYMDRADRLAGLLSQAEAEIRRLSRKQSERDQTS